MHYYCRSYLLEAVSSFPRPAKQSHLQSVPATKEFVTQLRHPIESKKVKQDYVLLPGGAQRLSVVFSFVDIYSLEEALCHHQARPPLRLLGAISTSESRSSLFLCTPSACTPIVEHCKLPFEDG
jgi:hypothetical protein